jgi:excisionase family DNA binding protein
MDIPIPEFSREQIPRFPHEREIRSIDPDLFNPVPPALQSIWPMMKAYRAKRTREDGPGTKIAARIPCMDLGEACAYLRLTERQLKDLCRDRIITHARIDYRTYRFKRADLDEWFEGYKLRRKSVYD